MKFRDVLPCGHAERFYVVDASPEDDHRVVVVECRQCETTASYRLEAWDLLEGEWKFYLDPIP